MSAPRQSLSFALAGSILALAFACSEPTLPVLEPLDASAADARRRPPKPDPEPEPEPDPGPAPAPDTQAPTLPVFSVNEIGPTHIILAWSSTDASNPILYRVEMNGALNNYGFETSKTIAGLQRSTTYSLRARARDMAGNWSEFSAPFTVTTTAADPNDATPPTTPAGVQAYLDGGGTEMLVMWGASTDNVTPQSAIIYQIAVNGVVDNTAVGKTESRVYGVVGDNVISVIAFDAAGNKSAAATFNIFIPF
jgi:chitodextrinase